MSTDWKSIVHDTGAVERPEEIDLTLKASFEALGAEGGSDAGAGPPLERIVLDPEAAGDDEVGITIEWQLEGVSVDSVIEHMPTLDGPLGEDTAFDRLAFDVHRGGDDEISVSLHGRLAETEATGTSGKSPLERIIIEPESE